MHERLTEPCTFIIDDWQFVASVTEVRGLWNQILRDAPPTCRFIFLSRAKPQLQFARFKTHSGYAELRTDALRFNDGEIEQLFREIYQDPLDPTELAELERRTEGWAASLQLVEVSLRERKTLEERRAFIESITATRDSDLFGFLAEEVLDQQDERTRNFLLATAILQEIPADLAERLAGVENGDRVLSDLEQRGLFTFRLGGPDGRYRYHGLFRDFLERRLSSERTEGEVTGLHIHAASYYETSHEWPAAIHHYLRAGLQPQAARLISRYGEEVASEGRLGLVDEWLQDLPPKSVRENARLSLLLGETQGIRGEWATALFALRRARTFFARKGDRRMEALACLKLSTVLANFGKVADAAVIAAEGLALAPPDATSIQLRLRGNIAITSSWLEIPFADLMQEFRRIIVEAKSRGWEHFAAIGLHNLGTAQRWMGDLEESVKSLELSAEFWNALPPSPFSDNSELVASLLAVNASNRAAATARTAVMRTAPWPRPNAEAQYGMALVYAYDGKFDRAIAILRDLLGSRDRLGPTAESVEALLIECLFLSDAEAMDVAPSAAALSAQASDPRLEPMLIPAKAIGAHVSNCSGECLSEIGRLLTWQARGAGYAAAIGLVKLAALALEHGYRQHMRFALSSLAAVARLDALRSVRWWIRRLRIPPRAWARTPTAIESLIALADADPDGWRPMLLKALPFAPVGPRTLLIDAIVRHATKATSEELKGLLGQDIADARRVLVQRHARRLFVSSFGALAIRRGGWNAPVITVERRRTRTLLGLLVAHAGTALTRDMVLDIMWPDADPAAAVNSLNQTVFQLRRAIDGDYRDGDSAQYIISTVDVVQLNPDLVTTDLAEFRRLSTELHRGNPGVTEVAKSLIQLVRGQFLSELRYEDWAGRIQTSVHAEVRDTLLIVATGRLPVSADLRIRAASSLIELDEFDDDAYVALVNHLSASGRHAAAREVIVRYAKRIQDELADQPSPAIQSLLEQVAPSLPPASST
jgi:DNA-binding SARP family transcriptional activator